MNLAEGGLELARIGRSAWGRDLSGVCCLSEEDFFPQGRTGIGSPLGKNWDCELNTARRNRWLFFVLDVGILENPNGKIARQDKGY